ncbi:MAG: PDZ domain-containing protein [Myxococcales bacterium]|nr:PDZ domain-containing protein [Myxococcales bacterium]
MRRTIFRRALGALLLLTGLASASVVSAAPSCTVIPEYMRRYLRDHVRYHELTPELEKRSIENHLRRLDPSRMLLTQDQFEQLAASIDGVFDSIKRGNCKPLTDLHKKLVRSHEYAAKFVKGYVDRDDYAIDETAELTLDPEDRGRPKTAAERDDLLRLLVHFQMSTYVSNGTELAEAKKKLVGRYERRFRRFLEITPDEIYAAFMDAFATALDPHSNYLSPKVLEDFRIGMSLSLEGIGVALSEQDGYAVAERIIPGGAAEKHGMLKPKDKIIAVTKKNGEFVDIIDMPLRDAVSLIRGKTGTTVGLTILRQGETIEKFNIEIVRAKIDLSEQAASLRFEDKENDGQTYKLAILELPSFYGDQDPSKRQCTEDVARLLRQVNEEKADGLLLDLSRNGGGLLQHAVTISGYFIRQGEIVGIEDSRGHRQILTDGDKKILYRGPMIVHTSRVSASASEILAGAMKDYARAVIVGDDHTFGKGTVQTVSPLPGNNGALKVTTALFFRPGGKSTQHSGVNADVVLPSVLASDDYGEKHQRFSLEAQTTTPFLGTQVNSPLPEIHWNPVNGAIITILAKRSETRVTSSTDFDKVRKRLAKIESGQGKIRVDEIMKRRQEEADEDEEEGSEADEDKPTPQLSEALRVLSDLVSLSRSQNTAIHASSPPAS